MSRRKCGNCSVCCTHVAVAAFDKPQGTPCKHQLEHGCSGSCAIYPDRPPECQQYQCSWLEGHFPQTMRPDLSGILFESLEIRWPKHLRILLGWEISEGAVPKHGLELMDAAGDDVLIMVLRYETSQPVIFGSAENVEAFDRFRENCEREGHVTHVLADGTFRQNLGDSAE